MTAALAIIDESGVEALTMRRLGQALDRNPMVVYRHAADKDALLGGVVDHVMSGFVVGDDPEAGWEQTLTQAAHTFRRLVLAHPNLVPLLVTQSLTRPLGQWPQNMLRPMEQLLDVLVSAGFSPRGALHAAWLFTGFLHGHVLQQLQKQVENPDETDDVLRLGLHRLPITEFPRLRSLASELAVYDGVTELNEGLAIILAGLHRQLGHRDHGTL